MSDFCVRAFSISDKTSDILPSLNLRLLKSRRLVTLRCPGLPGVITRLMLWVPVVAVSLYLWCTFYHSKFLEISLNNVQVGPSKRNQWPGSLDKEGHWHDNVGSDISRHIIAVSWLWLRGSGVRDLVQTVRRAATARCLSWPWNSDTMDQKRKHQHTVLVRSRAWKCILMFNIEIWCIIANKVFISDLLF